MCVYLKCFSKVTRILPQKITRKSLENIFENLIDKELKEKNIYFSVTNLTADI